MRELTNDELSKLSNEDLKKLFLEVRAKINKAKKNKKKCLNEEVYFCYISREYSRRLAEYKF